MTYIGLANKYRPRLLTEILGQDFLIKGLSASIEANSVAGAVLLSGSYGTGKTTTARAVSLSLLCLNRTGALPCLKCDSCISALNGSHPDILEIDAASNTGVEDVRILIEGALYKPLISTHKSYIIDEVHMLSQSAFNALLKLLEEPPEHVKFFLATTELQKIPATIISRCQHYRLARLDKTVIAGRVRQIAEKEQIKISKDAIELIGEKSGGSLRDALSVLEQVALHSLDEEITVGFLRKRMGLADLSEMHTLLEHITAGSCTAALKKLNELYYEGYEIFTIFEELIELINHKIQKILALKEDKQLNLLRRLARCMVHSTKEVKLFNNDHNVAELAIIRMAYLSDLPSPGEIIQIFSQESSKTSSATERTSPTDNTELTNYVLKEFDDPKIMD